MKNQKICIIGGNLTGLVTAISLSKFNCDIDLITDNALVGSRGDAKRLIKQGAVSIDGNKVSDINFEVSKSNNPQILKAGKRKFIKIV